jgi:YD repeat-containing protein
LERRKLTVTSYTYTNRDQVLVKTTRKGALAYSYDLAGNVASTLSSNTSGISVNYVGTQTTGRSR